MPIDVFCQSCQKKLRVPDTAAGKRIKCPKCQGVLSVPAASGAGSGSLSGAIPTPSKMASKSSASLPVPTPSAPKSGMGRGPARPAAEQWFVQTEDGQQYGPVSRQELDQWYGDGRITTDTQILREGSEQWQWASDLYPDLSPEQAAASAGGSGIPDFGAMSSGSSAPASGGSASPFDFAAGSSTPATTTSVTSRTKGKKGGKKGRSGGKKGGGSPHIDYIAYVCYAMGGLVMLFGLIFAAGSATVVGMIAGKDATWLIPICIGMGVFMMIFGLPSFAAGYGLQQRATWGRLLTIILAIIGALSFSPLNIAFAVWAWIVLTDKDNVAAFS